MVYDDDSTEIAVWLELGSIRLDNRSSDFFWRHAGWICSGWGEYGLIMPGVQRIVNVGLAPRHHVLVVLCRLSGIVAGDEDDFAKRLRLSVTCLIEMYLIKQRPSWDDVNPPRAKSGSGA